MMMQEQVPRKIEVKRIKDVEEIEEGDILELKLEITNYGHSDTKRVLCTNKGTTIVIGKEKGLFGFCHRLKDSIDTFGILSEGMITREDGILRIVGGWLGDERHYKTSRWCFGMSTRVYEFPNDRYIELDKQLSEAGL